MSNDKGKGSLTWFMVNEANRNMQYNWEPVSYTMAGTETEQEIRIRIRKREVTQ